jgi:ribose 5-phosphate isomerase A
MTRPADPAAAWKEAAAARAVTFVRSGMKVGLGTGSTAAFAIQRLAELFRAGQVQELACFATSRATRTLAVQSGLPMMSEDLPAELDLTIDGADEVDPQLDLIKGGGGALLHEKITAQASRRTIIVVDESKLSPRLGTLRAVPVEVVAFGWSSQARYLSSLGAACTVRKAADDTTYRTDSGHMILDCRFGPIAAARQLDAALNARAGIVGHGLFLGLATDLIVAGAGGVVHTERPGS